MDDCKRGIDFPRREVKVAGVVREDCVVACSDPCPNGLPSASAHRQLASRTTRDQKVPGLVGGAASGSASSLSGWSKPSSHHPFSRRGPSWIASLDTKSLRRSTLRAPIPFSCRRRIIPALPTSGSMLSTTNTGRAYAMRLIRPFRSTAASPFARRSKERRSTSSGASPKRFFSATTST